MQLVALFVVLAFVLCPIPIGLAETRLREGTLRGWWRD